MYKLKTRHRIYASHKLKDQGGKCTRLHGHQYEIILETHKNELDYKNMVYDTHEINERFNEFIQCDHLDLNTFMNEENPTMEYMSKYFYDNLKQKIPELYSVTVYETPEASVTYKKELLCI